MQRSPTQGVTGQHTRLALCVLAIVSLAIRAQAQCQYELTIIQAGPPNCDPLPQSWTYGNGINESAQVVGNYVVCALGGDEAFLWDGGPNAITLTRPPSISSAGANDINDAGQIVGTMVLTGIGSRAFLYDGAKFIDLGTMPGGNNSRAFAINSVDQIVGRWGGPGKAPSQGAFLWQEGAMTDLNALLGTPMSEANDINDAGQIVGWMGEIFTVPDGGEAFIWDDGQITPLGQVAGSYFTTAEAINEVGQVVGSAVTGKFPVTGTRAFLWDSGQMIDLGILPGAERSAASDINDAGQIVGGAWGSGGSIDAGLIWHDGMMIDLNDLIQDNLGVQVLRATAINNHGQITGVGVVNSGGAVGVFLTPIPRPGDLDGDCSVGIVDFLAMLLAWGPCPGACPPSCVGDLDGDCTVGIIDFLMLLANWGP